MLIARYRYKGRPAYGVVEGQALHPIDGDIFGDFRPAALAIPLTEVRLLAPVPPGKILGTALNYPSHLGETPPPANPEFFLKPPSAVIGPEEAILLPPHAGRVDCEGELVAVIGRRCRGVSAGEALKYVFGYTCGNDVSARHWQRDDLQWWRAKGSDTFCPIGPIIATGLDPANLELRTLVNGRVCQQTNTSQLIYSVARLISFASQAMTLEAGDVIFSGTPGKTTPLSPGAVVEVEVEGIGVLRNPVRAG